jgi:hypothetical protein
MVGSGHNQEAIEHLILMLGLYCSFSFHAVMKIHVFMEQAEIMR